MDSTVDAALAEAMLLSERINALPDGPERTALIEQRDGVRAQARLAADAGRPRNLLVAELAQIEAQLDAVDEVAIKPAFSEGYKLITDPSAYRRRINESIAANEADRRDALLKRRGELLAAIEQVDQSDSD